MKEKIYSIISHTHWDREWYMPFEQFRIRLVDLMDNLLAILANDKQYRFHLDAQTIVLDDYLEIRPEKKEEIEGYVKEGRLLIGPWYVQNDFHLTDGEATVRNLLIGTKNADSFGGCMKVGYCADQFGIISQLPQILNGFDIDTCVFGRGYYEHENQFYWKTRDGSSVLCEHMAEWYNNLQRLPEDAEKALAFIRFRGEQCQNRAEGSGCLLMNGVDHLEAQENLTDIINNVRPLLNSDETLIQDTLPEYMQRLKDEIKEKDLSLKAVEGELRQGGQVQILTGTLSIHVPLKQKNARLQALLEHSFEPDYSLLSMLGIKEYPLGYSDYLWRTLIQNHPHDSICACSIDAVPEHMTDRFVRIEENLAMLGDKANEEYLKHVDRTSVPENSFLVMCRNNSLYDYSGTFTAQIDIPADEDTGGFTLSDKNGKNIYFEVLNIQKGYIKRIFSPINLPAEIKVNRYTVQFSAGKIPGLSRKVLVCTPCTDALEETANTRKHLRTMENEHLKVKVNDNGTVDLTHKRSGRKYSGILYFEDNADRGTVYYYEHGTDEEKVNTLAKKAKISVVRDTKLESSISVRTKLKIDRDCGSGDIPIEMILTLKAGSKRLDVQVNTENSVEYHRLRVMLPTDIDSDKSFAGQPFDIVERTKISPYNGDENHPNTDFVGIEDKDGGIAFLNEGLYEYEQMTDSRNTLALTLYRSIGRITHSWQYRQFSAEAWQIPGAQMKGKLSFNFAVYPYAGDRISANVANEASQFLCPPRTAVQHCDRNKFISGKTFVQSSGVSEIFCRPLEKADIVVPLEKTFATLTQNTENAMMLSALKGAEDKNGIILRLYNTVDQKIDFSLSFGQSLNAAYLTNLNEDNRSSLKITRGKKISLSAGPKEIVTVRIVLKRGSCNSN